MFKSIKNFIKYPYGMPYDEFKKLSYDSGRKQITEKQANKEAAIFSVLVMITFIIALLLVL